MPGNEAELTQLGNQAETGDGEAQDNLACLGCFDGWKDIAAYVRRDVRTVQRWEKSLGLPIRRIQDSKSGSVYAYQNEIDAWRRNRAMTINSEKLSVVMPSPTPEISEPKALEPSAHVRGHLLTALFVGLVLGAIGSRIAAHALEDSWSLHRASHVVSAHDHGAALRPAALMPRADATRVSER